MLGFRETRVVHIKFSDSDAYGVCVRNVAGAPSRASVIGLAGSASAAIGWLLEWYRQRGTCELGDQSPDTLAISVALILGAGALCGIIGVVLAVGARRRHKPWRSSCAIALLSIATVIPLFAFAGRGPGSWFQYCAT